MKSWLLVAGICLPCFGASVSVPILVYHRISNGKPGATTVTPKNFRGQMETLRGAGFHFLPLADLVAWKAGRAPAPAPRSVVITFDDGHASFFTDAKPIIDQLQIPVTQFLVTGCISQGTYCVSWEEVAKLEDDPLIDLESHTWNHPTFLREARRRRAQAYRYYVDYELVASRSILEKKLKRPIPMLAWPYGAYTPMLLERAASDGYKVAFSVECRSATESDPTMAIPRCMVLNSDVGDGLLRLMKSADEAATEKPVNRKWRIDSLSLKLHTNIE